MALTQVRAKLGDTWVDLVYNEATGRYEGTLTAPGTSIHQPGGYYNLEVEAANDTGKTASLTGAQFQPLRLVVREDVSPTLTIISPPAGWLLTGSPVITVDAVDESGGSGVDPDTFSPAGGAVQEIDGGYRYTWSPPEPWADGPHTVTFSVSDRDGNTASVSAAYTVDTVPPVLRITAPDLHRVVDLAELTVAGYVRDALSGPAGVTINGTEVPLTDGVFSAQISLEVGVNLLQVTARDNAGLTATETITVLRLVTDRTQADADKVASLMARGMSDWTAEELAWVLTAPCLRGSYDAADYNRVGQAVAFVSQWLSAAGYWPRTNPKTDWTTQDVPTQSQTAQYLKNIRALRPLLPIQTPEPPQSMDNPTIQGANDIERILVTLDSVRPRVGLSSFVCGEIFCGEV